MNTALEDDFKKLQADLSLLRGDLTKLTQSLGDTLRHGSNGPASGVQARASEIRDDVKHTVHALTDHIEAKPIASALTSFVVGLVLGMAVNSRRS
jgi:ElaB/YqjD/DUF883 family membrane-anchored ribosome-binding protein